MMPRLQNEMMSKKGPPALAQNRSLVGENRVDSAE